MTGLFGELKRRNVFRVAVTYLIAAWVVAQVAGLAADAFEAPAWIMQMIITVLVIGFFPAVIFAWIFELSPEGLRRERDLVEKETVNRYTAKKLDIAVIVLLLSAIGLLLADRFVFDTRAPAPTVAESTIEDTWQLDSIAVLPFADFSPDRSQAWLGEGIAETLLHALAQIDGLRVSARTSSFAYRDRAADVATIGRELNVATVLEGSVQRAGDQLRVVAQLVRTDTHDHIFSKTFNRNPDDIFAIQDEIAAAVAEALMGTAAPLQPELARTGTDVYDQYLEGRQLWQERTADSVTRAVQLLEQAVEQDPDYGPARSELATALLFSALYAEVELDDVREAIEAQLEHALRIDPEDPQAWATRGLLFDELGMNDPALEALHKAESLAPSDANIQVWLANRYNASLMYDRALDHFRRAFELDPLNPFVRRRYVTMLSWMDRNNPAIERVARDSVRLFPEDESNWSALLNVFANRGRHEMIVLTALEGLEYFPRSATLAHWLASSLNQLGDFDTADLWREHAKTWDGEVWQLESWFLFIRGEPEATLAAARRDYRQHGERAVGSLLSALAINGQMEEAWTLVEQQLDDLDRNLQSRNVDDPDIERLVLVTWLARELGRDELAKKYLHELEALWAEIAESHVMADNIHGPLTLKILSGRDLEARAMLAQVSDRDALSLEYMLRHNPMFRSLAESAEGRQVQARGKALRQQMLDQVRAEAPPVLYDPGLLPAIASE